MADFLRSAELIVTSVALLHFVGGFAGASLATLSWQRNGLTFPVVAGTFIFLGWQAMSIFAGVHLAGVPLSAADMNTMFFATLTSAAAGAIFASFVGATADFT